MCNLSQEIRSEGIEIGMEEEITKGKTEEKLYSTLHYVMKLMQVSNISAEEAMNELDINEDIRPIILKSIEVLAD